MSTPWALKTEDQKDADRAAGRRYHAAHAEERRAKAREYHKGYYRKNADKIKARSAAWQRAHPGAYAERQKVTRLKRRYGLTPVQLRDHLIGQAGRCAICSAVMTPGNGTHIDHDHDTGAFRGLLCSGCNHVLGFAKDDPAVLESAARYLRGAGR